MDLTLGEAAHALGVSQDTLRRWDRTGKLVTTRDARNRRLVPRSEVERLSGRPPRHSTGDSLSARGAIRATTAPIGTLTNSTQRQDR